MTETRSITFKGKEIILTRISSEYWADPNGTWYPNLVFDEDFCGIPPIETGKGDPWWKRLCAKHDRSYNLLKISHPDKTGLQTFGKFTVDIATGALEGLYLTATAIPYWLVGGVGGLIRWYQLGGK